VTTAPFEKSNLSRRLTPINADNFTGFLSAFIGGYISWQV
jgi:hypothetical protein